MKYIDIHCHLDFPDYKEDFEGVLGRMKKNGVGAITIGTDLESSRRAVEIAEKYENTRLPLSEDSVNSGQVWACIGVHPDEASVTDTSFNIREIETNSLSELFDTENFSKLVSHPKVVAIGECGLDFFRTKEESKKEIQKKLFVEQIEFATKYNKPLMLHCRNAYDEVIDILQSYKKEFGEKLRGNCHFFAGNIEQATKFLDLGFSMSFTGVITFATDYDEVVKFLPAKSIMSETDAPFVAPVPYRGKRNEPVFVMEVVKKMAVIRGETEEFLEKQILANAQKLFGFNLPN